MPASADRRSSASSSSAGFVFYRLEVERQEAERRLEPLALALVNGEEIEAVDARDTGVLAGLLSRYARQVTGDSRSALASYLERSGGVEREVAELG